MWELTKLFFKKRKKNQRLYCLFENSSGHVKRRRRVKLTTCGAIVCQNKSLLKKSKLAGFPGYKKPTTMAYLCPCSQAIRRATTIQITGSNSSYDNQAVIIILPVYLLKKKKAECNAGHRLQIPKHSHMYIFFKKKNYKFLVVPMAKFWKCVGHACINPDSWENGFHVISYFERSRNVEY